MNGMLLAAGVGERMEPLSSWLPKPALDVCGKPLLASSLAQLRAAGCDPVVVNLHRHPLRVAEAVRACEPTTSEVVFSHEPALLGSAGGVAAARRFFSPGAALVGNADAWSDLDLAPLLAAGDDDAAVLAVLPNPDRRRWSSVLLGPDGLVSDIVPPGETRGGYLFTGFQLLGARVVAELPDPPAQFATVWSDLIRARRLRAAVVRGTWREAGTPAAYRELVAGVLAGASFVHPSAQVDDTATVRGSAVSAACHVGPRCALDDTVVTATAAVGASCRLRRCVVAGPVRLADGREAEDRLLLPDGDRPL